MNSFKVMGTTEKISMFNAVFGPLIILSLINLSMLFKINEK